ncbi:hypothetical protein [Alteromonas ponticola]|uniref:Sulfotransferase family protein n=1 Tax=Alteromonas ponticola TaxID=2720613 RepID=A0ABX1R3F3_9ALTE|nr:hypothetical protein [Alteromonas ponticola]NMH60181.1 hypothetical protein [Alteromonas ponticola]
MKTILHIGMGKAGSSTIQNVLLRNREKLISSGCLYPLDLLPNKNLGGDNQKTLAFAAKNNALSRGYMSRYKVSNPNQFAQFKKDVVCAYQKQLKACKQGSYAILSAEQLWSELVNVNEISNLKGLLEKIGFSVEKIVFYVREQSAWVNSYLHQKIKEGSLKNFELPFSFNFLFDRLNYLHTSSMWQSVFTEAEIDLRVFDKNLFFKSDLIFDFLHATGKPDLIHLLSDYKILLSNNVNESNYNENICKSIVYFNQVSQKSDYLKKQNLAGRKLAEHLVELDEDKSQRGSVKLITQEEVRNIRVMFESSNKLLFEQYNLNAQDFNFEGLECFPEQKIVPFNQETFFEYYYKSIVKA